MTSEEVQQAMQMIDNEQDANMRQLLLAGLVSALFRERGFEPVIVGGSAIEFYTDGAYMSGDVDVCWSGKEPSPAETFQVMGQLPGAVLSGTRTWKVAGLFVDILGEATRRGGLPLSILETPLGEVALLTVEELIVERTFSARCWTGYNAIEDACAKKLVSLAVRKKIPCDWDVVLRIASSDDYRCAPEIEKLRQEVEDSLR